MQNLEQLSELIITVLKELSSARQPLTNSSLGRALSEKLEFHDLLSRTYQDATMSENSARGSQSSAEEAQAIRAQLRKARETEQRFQRQVANLEEVSAQIRSFYKKAALTLILLSGDSQNTLLGSCLERYRVLIMSDADLSLQEECIHEIKDIVLREGVGGAVCVADEQKLAMSKAHLKEAPELAARSEPLADMRRHLLQMQSTFLAILGQFEALAPNEYQQRFGDLRQLIKASGDLDALLRLGGELTVIIEAYFGYASKEREQISAFISELANNLSEMEKQCASSANDTQGSYQANVEFNSTLQLQMEDIRQSFSIAKTLEESRNYVFAKLQAIKAALEQKRQQDEIRLRSNNEKLGELQMSLQTMKTEIVRVQERSKTLELEVLLDGLTGISNRRAYEIRIQEEMQRYQRYNQVFSLVLFDVDHFKHVNDQYGHRAGDKCLKEIIKRVKPCLRAADFLARYGGEEFIIIIPGTSKEDAYHVAEKIRRLVERTRFLFQRQEIVVTISLGVTEILPTDHDPETLFTRVDAGMYKAKRTGRNRVCVV